jgi:UDP:flavonoid glycosyltransferase YjiC (YdhE family)
LLGALAHGLPLLALPHAADQFDNADAAQRAGAGLKLLPDEVSVDTVREAVSDLLAAPSYRDAAQAIAAEIAAMPPPAETVEKIEELCRSTT